jgi:hypothetical protein
MFAAFCSQRSHRTLGFLALPIAALGLVELIVSHVGLRRSQRRHRQRGRWGALFVDGRVVVEKDEIEQALSCRTTARGGSRSSAAGVPVTIRVDDDTTVARC